MHFNPYGGVAAQIAVDLVNAGPGASGARIRSILTGHGYLPLNEVTDAEAKAVNTWAERLRAVFSAADQQEQVRLLNDLLAATTARPYISMHDGRAPHLHFADERAPLFERVSAYTAAGLAHVLCDDAGRIGLCDRPACGVVYVDISRNGRRRFCSTRCSTRVHVADHRSRQASTGVGA